MDRPVEKSAVAPRHRPVNNHVGGRIVQRPAGKSGRVEKVRPKPETGQ